MTSPTAEVDIDEIRRKCGLRKAQWSALGGDEPDRALELTIAHDSFISSIRRAIDIEFEEPDFTVDGVPYLSTVQAARALGVGEFHLSNLRDRAKLSGLKHGRRSIYSREDLLEFVTKELEEQERHSALAAGFLRYLKLQAA